jgi:general secretion pathway protein D
MYKLLITIAALVWCSLLSAITLQEKFEQLAGHGEGASLGPHDGSLRAVNASLDEKKKELLDLYADTHKKYAEMTAQKLPQGTQNAQNAQNAIDHFVQKRREEIKAIKDEIRELEDQWKLLAANTEQQDVEGLWHQPDTCIGQLIVDYGSSDYVWLIPPEIAGLKVHVSSQLSIPKSNWNEMLELLLSGYGVGVKQLNTFLRQLFFLRLNQSNITTITDDRTELALLPKHERICFVMTPSPADVKRIFQFLERFIPQEQMSLQIVGSSIVSVGLVKEIAEVLKIYDFISSPKHSLEYRLISLQKAHSEEVAHILQSIFEGDTIRSFDGGGDKPMPFYPSDATPTFRIISLKHPAQSLFLLGRPDQLEKATKIIADIENRVGEVQEKTIYWYPCKNSEADELAKVLSQVYNKMIATGAGISNKKKSGAKPEPAPIITDAGPEPKLIVSPPPIETEPMERKKAAEILDNFIVDNKTNSIVMVVEAYVLPKLKDLIKLLDVPKKMVQIDILLFEKKIVDTNSFGLNLLNLGDAAAQHHRTKLSWNKMTKKGLGKGILNFAISRNPSGLAYDIGFNFLLSQEDVQINANPSVTTVNQTTAKIALVDEISLNTGVVEIDTTKATRLKDSYTRAQYGITIQLTPTIHAKVDGTEDENEPKYITLVTDINFDTPRPSKDSRPDVIRRNIKNEVRIADGETVILGGLRRKILSEDKEVIPFLGELPGVGKLFSTTSFSDSNTEMFIFLTPKIVPDPTEQYRAMRRKELMLRPGDIPEFLKEVEEAKGDQKRALFEQGIQMLFG